MPPRMNAITLLLIPPRASIPKLSTLVYHWGFMKTHPSLASFGITMPLLGSNYYYGWPREISSRLGQICRGKASFLMTHTRYAPLAWKRRRTSSCTAPLLEISGMLWASRSARTSTASTCTAFLNHAASSLLTSPPSLRSYAGTCGRGATTTSSNRSGPCCNSPCVYHRCPAACGLVN